MPWPITGLQAHDVVCAAPPTARSKNTKEVAEELITIGKIIGPIVPQRLVVYRRRRAMSFAQHHEPNEAGTPKKP